MSPSGKAPIPPISPRPDVVTVAVIKVKAAVVCGKVEGSAVEMMQDSGITVPLSGSKGTALAQGITHTEGQDNRNE